jgi:hypothetical protein
MNGRVSRFKKSLLSWVARPAVIATMILLVFAD